ncbi:MAG: hypothetical protein KF855_02940 [Acidobacteria bacterium]|nr:hypothetical protein [Acidobacteriota bacterium]
MRKFAYFLVKLLLGLQLTFAQPVADIGSRLELFVDDHLIESLSGGASLRLHSPTPKEIVLVHDAPWEGNGSGYHSVFKDGDKYKMYYKAWQHSASPGSSGVNKSYLAYAESVDGINWIKPALGILEFNGSKNNNIVLISEKVGNYNVTAGLPGVFKDQNPDAPADERYKALIVSSAHGTDYHGLLAYKSPDGINWKLMSDQLILKDDAFDNQNIAFWDPMTKEYRIYWRYWTESQKTALYRGIRGIKTATSKDFINWENKQVLKYLDSPEEHLYTSPIEPYFRAPHIYIGYPARYLERPWSPSLRALPEVEEREYRSSRVQRYGTTITDSLFMAGRDARTFKRWNEAFLRPEIERSGSWTYGDNFIAWGLIETPSDLPGAPNEISLYVSENYWKGNASKVRRYTLRLDGFVSVNGSAKGGELLTKKIRFSGTSLNLNFSSSAAGGILVEILDEKGNPIPNYSSKDCDVIFGDTIKRKVTWKGESDLSSLEGKVVQLRFKLTDADLYSFQFE